jgi:hypothetical protein
VEPRQAASSSLDFGRPFFITAASDRLWWKGQSMRGRLWCGPLRTVVAVVIAACVADCTAERVQIANYAQNKMVGLTKEQVLACMGPPASKATEGATEVWSYPSGNCTVNATMMDGKVKRMNYVGPTGALLSQNEQCFFTVANCTY